MSSFAIRNLSVLAYAQGFTHYLYKASAQDIADMLAPGFFNAAADMLATGDHIAISARDGGAAFYVSRGDAMLDRPHTDGLKGIAAVEIMARTAPREAERIAA